MSIPTPEAIADTLAYYNCRRVNAKADDPIMGYHTFSEDQREHLRDQQAEAAAEIHRMMTAALSAAAPSIQAAALRDAAEVVQEECYIRSGDCFCGSAQWLIARAETIEGKTK